MPDNPVPRPALTADMLKDRGPTFCDAFIDSNVTQD